MCVVQVLCDLVWFVPKHQSAGECWRALLGFPQVRAVQGGFERILCEPFGKGSTFS